MSLKVSNAIIIPCGAVGYQMAEQYRKQLLKRHPEFEIPTVKFVPILEETPGRADFRELPALGIQPLTEYRLGELASKFCPDVQWPDDPGLVAKQLEHYPRLRAQVALVQHIYELQERLVAAHAEIFNYETREALDRLNIAIEGGDQTQVFILMSLADPFMTGLLPDLPHIVQYVLSKGMSVKKTVDIHLVLSLPGFIGELEGLSEYSAGQRDAIYVQIRGWAKACLDEIDYYLAQARRYQRKFADTIDINTKYNPLGQGRIYLLENTNEDGIKLAHIDALAAMVGDWLYHVTLTSLNQLLTPRTTTSKMYSSFGHCSLSIPISAWVHRASLELQKNMLREIAPPEQAPTLPNIQLERDRLNLSDSIIRDKLVAGTRYQEIKLEPAHFRGIPDVDPTSFLKRVQGKYDRAMGQDLIDFRKGLGQRLRVLTSTGDSVDNLSLLPALKESIYSMLDDPRGGVSKAQVLLKTLSEGIKRSRQRLIDQRAERQDEVNPISGKETGGTNRRRSTVTNNVIPVGESQRPGYSLANRFMIRLGGGRQPSNIAEARQMYFDQSQIASGPFNFTFTGLAICLLLIIAPTIFFINSLRELGWSRYLTISFIALVALTVFFLVGRAISRLRLSRLNVIRLYNQRLLAFLEIEILDASIRLYDTLVGWISDIHSDINSVWLTILEMSTRLDEEWEMVADLRLLSDQYQEGVSQSLLTPNLIRHLEEQTRLSNMTTTLDYARQKLGTPGRWLKERTDKSTLAQQFDEFAVSLAQQELRKYDLSTVLTYMEEEGRKDKFSKAQRLSSPYWQHDPTREMLSEKPWQVVAKADSELDMREGFGSDFQEFHIQDPYELVVSSARHGILLSEMRSFCEVLAESYLLRWETNKVSLHSLSYRGALPDPRWRADQRETLDTLSVVHLYAVARAHNVIHLGQLCGESELTTSYMHGEREAKIAIGAAKTIEEIKNNSVLEAELRQQVTRDWQVGRSITDIADLIEVENRDEAWVKLAAADLLELIHHDEQAFLHK